MGSFDMYRPAPPVIPPQYAPPSVTGQPTNTGVTGGMLGGVTPTFGSGPDTGAYQAGPGGGTLGNPSGGTMDYQTEFLKAAQELGISPQQFRGNPQVMDQVTNYLNQKYPGQNWTNGGARAGDWVSAGGQGFDVLPAGDKNWQWLSDPADSTAGSGGNTLGTIGQGAGLAAGLMSGDPTQMIENTPGYQFLFNQAVKGSDRSAAARGTLLSGGYPAALGKYLAGAVAMPAYQQQMNYLQQLSGLGFNAANQTGGYGAAYANNAGSIYGEQGNAAANGTVGAANAGANATNSVINSLGQVQWPWNKPSAPTPPTNSSYTPPSSTNSTDTNVYE